MRKEWVWWVEFFVVFAVWFLFFFFLFVVFAVSAPARLGVVPGQGCPGRTEGKDFPSLVQKWALSCLKYIQMRGIFVFSPQKRTRNTWSPLSVKLNSGLRARLGISLCCCCPGGGRGFCSSGICSKRGWRNPFPLWAAPQEVLEKRNSQGLPWEWFRAWLKAWLRAWLLLPASKLPRFTKQSWAKLYLFFDFLPTLLCPSEPPSPKAWPISQIKPSSVSQRPPPSTTCLLCPFFFVHPAPGTGAFTSWPK